MVKFRKRKYADKDYNAWRRRILWHDYLRNNRVLECNTDGRPKLHHEMETHGEIARFTSRKENATFMRSGIKVVPGMAATDLNMDGYLAILRLDNNRV